MTVIPGENGEPRRYSEREIVGLLNKARHTSSATEQLRRNADKKAVELTSLINESWQALRFPMTHIDERRKLVRVLDLIDSSLTMADLPEGQILQQFDALVPGEPVLWPGFSKADRADAHPSAAIISEGAHPEIVLLPDVLTAVVALELDIPDYFKSPSDPRTQLRTIAIPEGLEEVCIGTAAIQAYIDDVVGRYGAHHIGADAAVLYVGKLINKCEALDTSGIKLDLDELRRTYAGLDEARSKRYMGKAALPTKQTGRFSVHR